MAGFNLFDFSAPLVPQTASVPTSPKPSEDKDLRFLKELKNRGYTAEQAYQALQSVKQGKEPDFAVAEPKEDGGFFSSIESGVNYLWGGIGNVVGGFVEEVPRSVAGMATVASWLGSAIRSPLSPVEWYRQGVEDAWFVNRAAERVAGAVREYGAYEPDSTGAKIGEVGAQLASTVAMPGGVMKTGAKWLELGARWAAQWVLEMGKFTAASEGRLPTGTEAAIWGTLGAAIPLAWQALASTWKALTRKFPIATVMNDLKMTPTERKTIEKITGKNAAEYVLGKNLGASSKEELAAYFDQQAVNAFKSVNEKLWKVNVRVKSAPAKEAIKDIVEQMESSPKLKRAYAEDISYLKTLLKQKDYSPVELNNLRRAFDKVNTGMFTASWKMRSGLEADVDVRIREAISDEIEKAAKSAGFSVKEINNELRAGLTMKDAMLRSLSQEQKNNLVGLQDIGIMGVFSGGDPGTAIALGIAKRWLEWIRPGIAQKLYNLDKTPSATLPALRGNTVPARLKSGLIPRTDTVPIVPPKVTKPLPLKKAGNAQNPTQSLKSNELPIKKGVNAPTVGEPTTPTRKGVSLSNIGKEKWGFLQIGKSTEPKPLTEAVDDWMDSLRNEAKKYKSAEEFINARGKPLYHWTDANFEVFDYKKIGSKTDDGMWGRWFYLSDKLTAKNYGNNIKELYVSLKNPLEINRFKTISEAADYLDMSEDALQITNGVVRPKLAQAWQFSSHAIEKWHDGIILKRSHWVSNETVIFNPENIKTKYQLIDIYNQAHKSK